MQGMTATIDAPIDKTPVVSYFSQDRTVTSEEKNERGNLVVRGLKVFRAGTFADSSGRKRTWTTDELDQMVANYSRLRDGGLFVDVPVREDHSTSVTSVVGYFERIYRAGDFLLADFEFTEPEAAGKWERKTFRARSLEVGPYLSNDDQLFWPVTKGLAFVDMGAVEHLHRQPEHKETPPVTTPEAHTFRINGVNTTDLAQVQARIDELEAAATKAPEVHEFRLPTGETVQDYAKVQSSLDSYAAMFTQLRDKTREDFVTQLATDNKIAAPGIEDETKFAKSLSDEQFEAYRKRWEGAPAQSMFAAQTGPGAGNQPPAPPATEPTELETHAEVVANFRRGNIDEAIIKEMPSYKALVAAGKAPF